MIRSTARVGAGLLLAAIALGGCASRREPSPPPVFEGGPTPHTRRAAEGDPRGATVEDLAFLAGHWRGEGLGGEVEETWSPPLAGEMLGSFRLIRNGAPSFYEILVLSREDDRIVMRIKHFNPGLLGWEEKDESLAFPLIEVRDGTAWFHGLTLHRDGDHLLIYLAMRRGGVMSEMEFRLRREAL